MSERDVVVTAPDPGLTDFIAADLRSHRWGHEYENAAHEDHILDGGCKVCRCDVDAIAARALFVVEQHTNGRIAELYEQRDNAIEAGLTAIDRAENAEAKVTELEAERDSMTANYVTAIGLRDMARDRAETAEATIARAWAVIPNYAVESGGKATPEQIAWLDGAQHVRRQLRAALEGES